MSEPVAEHDERVQQLAADIAARLRGVCSSLTDEDFNQLVMDIARMKLRFEVLEDLPGGMRPLRQTAEPDTARRDDAPPTAPDR